MTGGGIPEAAGDAAAARRQRVADRQRSGHARWVRLTHWMAAVSVAALTFSGVEILMVHPRLYWGEAGNDLTPSLLELPISRNYRHGGWTVPTPLLDGPGAPVSAGRTFEIFNENGWGRSLHFLAAWLLVAAGLVYVLAGVVAGHFHRHFIGGREALSPAALGRDLREHLRGAGKIGTTGRGIGPAYEDKMARRGLRFCDFQSGNDKALRQRIAEILEEKNILLRSHFKSEEALFDCNDIHDKYAALFEKVKPYLTDASKLINERMDQGATVLFEECPACKHTRHALLPACAHCGKVKEIATPSEAVAH